jgi:hypothetical protein
MKSAKFAIQAAIVAVGLSVLPLSFGQDVTSQGSVSFVSGGVGEDQSQTFKSMARDYPLELMFVTKGNPNRYLADVKVQIKDKNGAVVLDTTSNGPFLLAKVPPGKYSITAESEGGVKRQTVQVAGGKTQRAVFVWDVPTDIPPVASSDADRL